ncbi:MAG: HAD family hydrolase [Thermoplasmata archaeon]
MPEKTHHFIYTTYQEWDIILDIILQDRRIEALFFDLDGTLLHTELVSVPATIETLKELNRRYSLEIRIPEPDEVKSCFGMTVEEYLRHFLGPHYNGYAREFDIIVQTIEVEYIDAGMSRLYPGTLDTLENLRRMGIPMAIATNAPLYYCEKVISAFHLDRYIAYYEAITPYPGKQKDHLIQLLKNKISVNKILMVGDRAKDRDAAKATGDLYGAATWGYGNEKEWEGADFRFNHISEVEKVIKELREFK